MNDLQIYLNEKANVTDQMNPFFNDYVTSNKKGLHQKNITRMGRYFKNCHNKNSFSMYLFHGTFPREIPS